MNMHIRHAEEYVQDDRKLPDEVMQELDLLGL
jgi:hypothetical protein